ncbi:TolB family protein [Mucilaginibacter gotjawali]|uniref:Uncharacterized protein n=2 Tax=Mucilaginibacter gotjawali TaxID=1550579 RepID=A0A839SAP7_9SPHI|nr:hypothetical protein [Mucilaginibacter gotjawali]MBB3053729.1 hypothetical protein [Mucilaginibacter gotjawali]BAU53988.1 hypothetical protein MgSA37_02159 [Mucilaginibacter gotjawali]
MKSPFYLLLLLLITATATKTIAQEFGGNPPSIKWKQIDLPAAKVIFPYGLDSAGLRVANIIRQMNGSIQPTIGFKQRQISIVLQDQTTISNAYVGLAPFRSEFYLTPEQNSFELGSLSWPEQLAIHEFRHVQQYNNFNVGFSHALKVLFGEGGQALGNDIAIPNWFFEGDAVFNETHVSEQGRGRLPYFFNGYRGLWAAGKEYSYMKLRNGSYRDYIPDWYPLGYMMVSYGREKYGDDFWKKVTHDAAAYKGVFFPLQKAIKRYTGKDFDQFRNDGFDFYKKQFGIPQTDNNSLNLPLTNSLNKKHFDADREYPVYINDSTLIYMKSTYNHIPVFVEKTGNHEQKIAVRSVSLDTYFAYHNGKVVYPAYRRDLRWNYRDYSELMLLDVNTGEERRLTKGAKYFAPDFSPDGKTIVAVKEGTNGNCDLHLINATDGSLIAIVPNKENLFYTYPKFYGDNQLIAAVRTPKGEMTLDLVDIKTGQNKYLLPLSYQPIAFPVVKNDTVYFSATLGIDDRLFAFSLKTGKLFELKNYNLDGSIGNYQPAVSNHKFAWVGFTAFGYRLNEWDKSKLDWADIEPAAARGGLSDFGISALTRDGSTDLLAKVKNDSLPVTKYRKSHHLLNFHSLIPNFVDPDYTISLAGENVLNTLQTQLSFTYNRDEGFKEFGFDAVYGVLFPYISAGSDYFIGRRGYHNGNNVYWNETDMHGGFELPLNLSEGKNFTYLRAGSDLYSTSVNFQQPYRGLFADRAYTYLNYYLSFSNTIQQAKQNIYPRFGQSIYLNYKSAISVASSAQFLANGFLYLPGFMLNHNLVVNVAHQQKNKNEVINFSNGFPFSRGYTAENLYDMNKAGVNYHFPIAYPDAGFANTFYISRIRGNAFYDYTHATDFYTDGRNFKATFRSAGAEIYFDSKLFNQGNISFGFRYSYLMDPDIFGGAGRNRFEIIVPVTLF